MFDHPFDRCRRAVRFRPRSIAACIAFALLAGCEAPRTDSAAAPAEAEVIAADAPLPADLAAFRARLLAAELLPIEALAARAPQAIAIRLSAPPHDRRTFEALAELFARYRGDRRVSVELELRGHAQPLKVHADLGETRIQPSDQLLEEVERLCGKGTVSWQ